MTQGQRNQSLVSFIPHTVCCPLAVFQVVPPPNQCVSLQPLVVESSTASDLTKKSSMENKKEKHDATQDARKVKHAGTELQQRDLTHKGPTYASSPRSILRFTHALPHYISFCGKKKPTANALLWCYPSSPSHYTSGDIFVYAPSHQICINLWAFF